MMSKRIHMNCLEAHKVIRHLIFLLASLNSVWAGILIYDGGLGIEEFRDVELSNTEPISKSGIMGAIVAASPIDACVNISRPPDVNFTINWFALIAGNSCSFEAKVLNARYAGYAVAVIYISETKILHSIGAHNGHYSFFPNISGVVIGSNEGHRIRDNYLFEIDKRFRVYVFPNNSFSIMTFLLLFSIVTGLFLLVMLVFAVIRFFLRSSSVQRGRLSSRHLRQLQTSTYNKGNGSDSCAICLEEYKDQDKLRFLPCTHGYHARCIDPWLTNNRPICPVCKQKVVLEGYNSVNARDSDSDERSETTPLLQDRRNTQHGTFNLIYNPAGENVGDLNLPSTSVSENVGNVSVLKLSISSPGGGDSSNNSVTENLRSDKLSKDSAPKNIGVIKRLKFFKTSSPKNLGNSNVSISSTSNSGSVSADHVSTGFTATNLPEDSADINITGVDLSNYSSGSTNIGDCVILSSNYVPENFPGRNLSNDPAVANVGGNNLPGGTITGYVAGMNLSEFWPSDHLDKIKLSNDSLSRNQGGLNLSSDVFVSLGDINLSSDANRTLGDGNESSKSTAIGDINLPTESMSENFDGTSLSGKSVVANFRDINVSTDSSVANLGSITAPSDSVAVNLINVNASSDWNRTDLGGMIAADFAATNLEAFNVSSGSVNTNLNVSVSNEAVPINLGIDLPGECVTANLDESNLLSGASVSQNLGGINVSSPSISTNLGGNSASTPSVSANLGDINVSSPSRSINFRSVYVSSSPVAVSSSGIFISSPTVDSNLRDTNVSSSLVAASHGGITASSSLVAASHSGIIASSPSVAVSLGGINVSSDADSTNLGVNISSGAAAASLSDASVSIKPVAANRRRRRNFK